MNLNRTIIKINDFLIEHVGIVISTITRHSTKFAINHFHNNKIDVIEIGTYRGINAKNILKNLNVNKIYLIDPWEEYEDYSDSESAQTQKLLDKCLNLCKNRLKRYKSQTEYIREYSNNAVDLVPKVDFIYIDGNHETDYVYQDIVNYFPKLKENGIIGGHDIYWKGNNNIMNAVKRFCKENDLEFFVSKEDWWIVK